MRVFSFDVFDTLITRTVAEPRDLFVRLGEALQSKEILSIEPHCFAELRVEAELAARRVNAHPEISLPDIYVQLGRHLKLSDEEIRRIQELELVMEEQAIRGVPAMALRLKAARKEADKILFLSDMYLPSEFLRSVLKREGLYEQSDVLYVSHEHKASKGSGELFALIKKTIVPIRQWQHIGDNVEADVQAARRHGVEAAEFGHARLTGYERLVRSDTATVPLWRSQMAATMRLARLQNAHTDPERTLIWDSGCNVVGPLLFGFVRWCLEQALAHGIKRLYFISRDGEILLRIAQIVGAAWGYDLEFRYLYGSRKAWHPATLEQANSANLKWFFETAPLNSVRKVFAFLDLPLDSFEQALENGGFGRERWDQKLDLENQHLVQQLLLKPPFCEAIMRNSKQKRELVSAYLEQEGFWDGTPAAIVDMGWFGNLQNSLARILRLAEKPAGLTGYYFGLLCANRFSDENQLIGYWNRFSRTGFGLEFQNLTMFEAFTAGTHGSVVGYNREGSTIRPLFNRPKNLAAETWDVPLLQQAVCQFASTLVQILSRDSVPAQEYQQITAELYDLFYSRPSRVEAEVWGKFQYTDQPGESSPERMVPDWTCRETTAAIVDWRKRPAGWWPQGALAIRGCFPLSLYLKLRAIRRMLFK